MKTIVANTVGDVALLRCLDFEFIGAEHDGRRVRFTFADPDGKGEDLLRIHDEGGVDVNSREALLWAESVVSSMRGTVDQVVRELPEDETLACSTR